MDRINLDFFDEKEFYTYNFFQNPDKNLVSFLKGETGSLYKYPIQLRYLLNKEKENIYKFCNFEKNSDILLVNDCFGIISKYLSENIKNLTVLNFSKITAEIVQSKLKENTNYEIFVGNLGKKIFDKKFEYIILTDIIEFSEYFFPESFNPHLDLINYFKNLLSEDGTLIIEASNKFGFQNWIGIPDNIFGQNYISFNYKNFKIKPLSKYDLQNLLKDSELKYTKIYYPVPHHHKPLEIFSDQYIIDNYVKDNILKSLKQTYKEEQKNFDEEILLDNIIDNRKFDFFANSFLIFASNKKLEKKSNFYKYSNNTTTEIIENDGRLFLKKYGTTQTGNNILDNTYKHYIEELNRLKLYNITDIENIKCTKKDNCYYYDYIHGKTFISMIKESLKNKDITGIIDKLKEFKELLYCFYPNYTITDFKTNGLLENIFGKCEIKNIACVQNINLNINLKNIIQKDKKYFITKYNFILTENFPINYIFVAAILELYLQFGINPQWVLTQLDFSYEEFEKYSFMFENYKKQERKF